MGYTIPTGNVLSTLSVEGIDALLRYSGDTLDLAEIHQILGRLGEIVVDPETSLDDIRRVMPIMARAHGCIRSRLADNPGKLGRFDAQVKRHLAEATV